MDLEINWKGASLAEFKDKYGEGIDTLYTQLCEMEGQFFAYYYTPDTFRKLEEKAREALQDKFDPVQFNAALIKWGNVKFSLIEDSVDQYIAQAKKSQ